LSIFLQSHLATVVDYAEKYGVNIPLNEDDTTIAQEPSSAQQEEHDSLAALLQSATSHLAQAGGDHGPAKELLSNGTITNGAAEHLEDDGLDLKKLIEDSLSTHLPELKEPSADQPASAGLPDFDSKNLASLISEKLKNDLDIPTHGLPNLSAPASTTNPQFATPGSNIHPAYQTYIQGSAPATSTGAGGEVLPPNQSMPTAALYERARQAAVAKSSNTTRREGLHSTRRPWTPEEEKALMAGLDMVKGPHWSQILSLFGQHGTISDILKDRTQVQLKDKARNLKLFFLKTNSEMPYYLQSVTGELKTRAPGQAARKEAEEKARMNLEEEQARIQGIMTLAGGLQNNHHPVANPPLAASPSKRTSPATGFGATTTAAHVATSNGTSMPAMPIPPRIKTELSDQHLPKVTAFPPIQPAPAPGATMQAGRTPLPALQPQSGLHQHSRPPAQQQFQQTQQAQQPRPQEAQKVAMPLPQQQQQQRQPLPQHQPLGQQPSQQQPQAQPRPPSQSQSQQQPQLQQIRQTQPQQPQTPTPAQGQTQPQAVPRPPMAPQPQPQPSPQIQTQRQQTQTQTQQQLQQAQQQLQAPVPAPAPPSVQPQPPQPPPPQTHAQAQPQPLATPPIPPNHHSTPDHAQDTKLFETLQAAIAASTAGESGNGHGHGPVAASTAPAAAAPATAMSAVATVSEGTGGLN
jgi:hypothetical protein